MFRVQHKVIYTNTQLMPPYVNYKKKEIFFLRIALQRPPIYLRNQMTELKKNTYLIKTLIFNENINITECFARKLHLKPSPKGCIPDLEVLHTSDCTHPHTSQVSRIIINFWTVNRAAPDPWLATTPGQPEPMSVTVQENTCTGHSHSTPTSLAAATAPFGKKSQCPKYQRWQGCQPCYIQ